MGWFADHFKKAGNAYRDFDLTSPQEKVTPAGKISAELPPFETLPETLQDILSDANDVSDPIEKLQIIHDGVLGFMTYKKQANDRMHTLEEIIEKKGIGDCTDYATLETYLLRYAGFVNSNIENIGTSVHYTNPEMDLEHAVVVVTIDKKPYLLDMNLSQATPLIVQNGSLVAQGIDTGGSFFAAGNKTDITINHPYAIFSADGTMTVLNEVKEKMDKVFPLPVKPVPP